MGLFKRRLRAIDTKDTRQALEEIVRQINSMQDDLEQWHRETENKPSERKGGVTDGIQQRH